MWTSEKLRTGFQAEFISVQTQGRVVSKVELKVGALRSENVSKNLENHWKFNFDPFYAHA